MTPAEELPGRRPPPGWLASAGAAAAGLLLGGLATAGVLWAVLPVLASLLRGTEGLLLLLVALIYPCALLGCVAGERIRAALGRPVPRVDRRSIPVPRRLLFGVLGLAAGLAVGYLGLRWSVGSELPGLPFSPPDGLALAILIVTPTAAVMAVRAVERLAGRGRGAVPKGPKGEPAGGRAG